MKKLVSILTSRWLLTLVGALCLSALVWFLGPLVAVAGAFPLEDATVRMMVVFAILLVWALAMQWSLYRQRSANDRMVKDLSAPAARTDPEAEAIGHETDLLRQRLREAMEKLRKAKFDGRWGTRYLYQLPWYLLIGAPGTGKTTALVNSGLRFPLAAEMGRTAVRGFAGTRNCDWWFTDEAVLIDTAGRYTTQDSQPPVDARVWRNFMGLLKRHRPRQPVNGVLLAVSLSDLAIWSAEERKAHAAVLKLRLKELQADLGVRVPVYVMLTKADLIAGFAEFFDDLSREERDQVWGMTFPIDSGKGQDAPVHRFGAEFDGLTERLNKRVMERIHQESDIQRRSLDFLFPAQVAALKPAIADLLTELFEPNRYEERPLLRGVYLTSGTQDGAPIDRLADALAGSFGLERQVLPAGTGGRSFFINRMLREVAFAEANIVGLDFRMERRRRAVRRAAVAAMTVVGIAVAGFWANSFTGNAALVAGVDAAAQKAGQDLAPLANPPRSLGRVDDTDFAAIVPVLNTLRTIPSAWTIADGGPPLELTGGLYQGRRLARQSNAIYVRALRTVLLSRLFLRVEEQIRRERSRPEYLFQALKVYLMLGGKGPMDAALVSEWMALDWTNTLPGQTYETVRRDLRTHLDALLEAKFAALPADDALVEQARVTLTRYPLAERGFALLRDRPEMQDIPDWRLVDQAGPLAGRVLVRPSGKPLSEGVPGFYTYDGFHKAVLPALPQVAKALVDEGWVLGQPSTGPEALASAEKLERGILAVYLDRYARQWDELMGDVVIVPLRSLSHAADVLNSLSGPQSPLKLWLTAAVRETTLVPGPDDKGKDGKGAPVAGGPLGAVAQQAQAAEKAAQATGTNAAYLARLAGVNLQPAGPPPGQPINDHFAPLRRLVQGDSTGPGKLDDTIKLLGDLYQQVARAANAPDQNGALLAGLSGSTGGDRSAVVAQLRNLTKDLPQPVGGLVATVAQSSANVTVGGARSQINKTWQSTVLPFCKAALDNRFPMVKGTNVDVTSADFAKLFAPGGMIDQFFNTNLRPFVDMTVSPWVWQKVDQVDLGIPPAVLEQFERAAKIRDSLFPTGGAAARVVFEVTPVELDASATQVALDVDGQTLIYQHGPPRPMVMKWPNAEGTSSVRLGFGPPLPGEPAGLSRQGPWALFHFLADGKLEPTAQPDRFTFTATVGTRKVVLAIRADSVNNPFGKNLMESFKCPAAL